MTTSNQRAFGVLVLDKGLPPTSPPPTPRVAEVLDFPLIFETIKGGWADVVIRGDPALESAYISAARRLVDRGAVAISSNCGFSFRHQEAVAAAVNVPVALSSLLLLPMLLRQVPRTAKIGVVTADSTNLPKDLLGISDSVDLERVVIGGIEGGELLRNEMMRPPPFTSQASIHADVEACVARLRAAHPTIGALLFECAGFPIVSPALRHTTQLPIYDVADLCRMTFASAP